MMDVAREAGVSAQTVSRALRDPDKVTPETRRLIDEAIRKTRYVQNLSASHLASNRSMTIAAIIPTLSASVFAETIQGLTDHLRPKGYQIVLGDTGYSPSREEALIRSLLGRRPDGIFIVGTRHTRVATQLLKRAGVPVVESWGNTARPIDMLVGYSNRAAITDMVRHLVERGRKRLVFGGVLRPGDYRAAERFEAFQAAVAGHFSHEAPRLALLHDRPLAIATGRDILDLTRRIHPGADALMCSSDLIAAGALLAAGRAGLHVPDDLAITGFGDFEIAGELNPSLTTIGIPTARMGTEAARLLLASMNGEPIEAKVIDVGYRLMMRESG